MNPRYDFAISGEASRMLFGSPDRVRTAAEVVFDHLAKYPFTAGDFAETGPSGRVYQVKIFGDMIVTYWADHAARELRVVRCEIVESGADI